MRATVHGSGCPARQHTQSRKTRCRTRTQNQPRANRRRRQPDAVWNGYRKCTGTKRWKEPEAILGQAFVQPERQTMIETQAARPFFIIDHPARLYANPNLKPGNWCRRWNSWTSPCSSKAVKQAARGGRIAPCPNIWQKAQTTDFRQDFLKFFLAQNVGIGEFTTKAWRRSPIFNAYFFNDVVHAATAKFYAQSIIESGASDSI